MKNFFMFPLTLTMTVTSYAQVAFRPPVTLQKPVKDTLHNVVITDPFRWLEDKEIPKSLHGLKRSTITVSNTSNRLSRSIPDCAKPSPRISTWIMKGP